MATESVRSTWNSRSIFCPFLCHGDSPTIACEPQHMRGVAMIDLQSEQLLTLTQAARMRPLGRQGRPTHLSTVYRWISRGVRGHRLEAIRLGGSLYTSREAVQ